MNPEAQAILEEILKLDPSVLSPEQILFLRARRGYLKVSQAEEYASVLTVDIEPVPTEATFTPEEVVEQKKNKK